MVTIAVSAILAGSCAAPSGGDAFPAGDGFDYQLGGAYDPPDGVGIVVRDRAAEPAAGLYSICYVNAFQTQPAELGDWPDELILRDRDGAVVVDPDWPDEALLDLSAPARRDTVVDIVGAWIRQCADDGFDAVEFDNLDSFVRSRGAFGLDEAIDVAARLVEIAHDSGLAAGQKNAPEHARELRDRAGFDFAISEECAAFDECTAYAEVYGAAVLDIEYTDVCSGGPAPEQTILRDRALTTPGHPGYVFEPC